MNSLIIRILDSFGALKKVSDGGLVGQDSAQNSEDIERCSSKLTVVLDDGYEAVCDNCNIYLYSHSVLAGSPKGEQTLAKIYRRRIERVELAIENERPCDSRLIIW